MRRVFPSFTLYLLFYRGQIWKISFNPKVDLLILLWWIIFFLGLKPVM